MTNEEILGALEAALRGLHYCEYGDMATSLGAVLTALRARFSAPAPEVTMDELRHWEREFSLCVQDPNLEITLADFIADKLRAYGVRVAEKEITR